MLTVILSLKNLDSTSLNDYDNCKKTSQVQVGLAN